MLPLNKHEVDLDGSFLTSIFTIKNGITGGYFFLECILSVLPYSDKLFLNDGGSSDGTLEYLYRLQEIFPDKITIYKIKDESIKDWEPIDNGLNKMINDVKSEWIFEVQGDEILTPKNAKKAIRVLRRSKSFNSIRHSRFDYTNNMYNVLYDMRTVRFIRNIPNLSSYTGGDNFQIGEKICPRDGFSLHDVPPEKEDFSFHLNHYLNFFSKNILEKTRRHAQDLATQAQDRNFVYETEKHKISKCSQIISIPDHIPPILKGLVGQEKYFVRDCLFDKKWLPKVLNINI
jgi:hypothetical protein